MPDAREELDRIIDRFSTAMLVTESREGQIRARPVYVADHREGGILRFLGRASDAKNEEIRRDHRAAITMQGGDRFLSLSGRARLSVDGRKIREAWSPSQLLWFPGGLDDDQVTLIEFMPEQGEFWNRRGLYRLEYIWEAGKALLRREVADAAAAVGHAKIELRAPGRWG